MWEGQKNLLKPSVQRKPAQPVFSCLEVTLCLEKKTHFILLFATLDDWKIDLKNQK